LLPDNIGLDTKAAGTASTPVAGSAAGSVAVVEDAAATTVAAAATAVETTAAAAVSPLNAKSSEVVPDLVLPSLRSPQATAAAVSTGSFVEQAYADFQISGGSAGTAEAEANAVFVGTSRDLAASLTRCLLRDADPSRTCYISIQIPSVPISPLSLPLISSPFRL
jgi:hypothetical protein